MVSRVAAHDEDEVLDLRERERHVGLDTLRAVVADAVLDLEGPEVLAAVEDAHRRVLLHPLRPRGLVVDVEGVRHRQPHAALHHALDLRPGSLHCCGVVFPQSGILSRK